MPDTSTAASGQRWVNDIACAVLASISGSLVRPDSGVLKPTSVHAVQISDAPALPSLGYINIDDPVATFPPKEYAVEASDLPPATGYDQLVLLERDYAPASNRSFVRSDVVSAVSMDGREPIGCIFNQ